MILLLLVSSLAVAGIAATVAQMVRDGRRRVPTRAGYDPERSA